VLSRLVDAGNTVIVIKHNLDVIKTADWIVDMGPEGGSGGGTVVAVGSPETVAGMAASHTGAFLRDVLSKRPAAAKRPAKSAASPRSRAKSAPKAPASKARKRA